MTKLFFGLAVFVALANPHLSTTAWAQVPSRNQGPIRAQGSFGSPSETPYRQPVPIDVEVHRKGAKVDIVKSNEIYFYHFSSGMARPRLNLSNSLSEWPGTATYQVPSGAMWPSMNQVNTFVNMEGARTIELIAVIPYSGQSTETSANWQRPEIIVGILAKQVANFEAVMQGAATDTVPLGIAELDIEDELLERFELKVAKEELPTLDDLIRCEIWIGQVRSRMRQANQDAEQFRQLESELKKLVGEECDALLAKQKQDVQRVRGKLEQLEAELTRRQAAKDRLVEVQLGKYVLEAQGLLQK